MKNFNQMSHEKVVMTVSSAVRAYSYADKKLKAIAGNVSVYCRELISTYDIDELTDITTDILQAFPAGSDGKSDYENFSRIFRLAVEKLDLPYKAAFIRRRDGKVLEFSMIPTESMVVENKPESENHAVKVTNTPADSDSASDSGSDKIESIVTAESLAQYVSDNSKNRATLLTTIVELFSYLDDDEAATVLATVTPQSDSEPLSDSELKDLIALSSQA